MRVYFTKDYNQLLCLPLNKVNKLVLIFRSTLNKGGLDFLKNHPGLDIHSSEMIVGRMLLMFAGKNLLLKVNERKT